MKLSLLVVLFVFFGYAYGELALIAKSRSVLSGSVDAGKNVSTGIEILDEINAYYCCNKIEKIYNNIKDTILAKKLGMDRVYQFNLQCNLEDTNQIIQKYKETRLFEYVEINQEYKSSSHTPFYPVDPAFSVWQWSLNNNGKVPFITTKEDVDIDMPEGWGIEQGDSSVIIAILDSGIKNNSVEFQGRIWVNKDEIPGNQKDDDSNGFIDDVNGWDFVNSDTTNDDDYGHGTAITSIIASNFNDQGMAGVNGKSKIMIIKITDTVGSTSINNLVKAISYSVDKGARVINLSFAGTNATVTVQDAIKYAFEKNVVVCAGVGNNNISTVLYPAKFAHVIGVGATDPMDKRGKDWVMKNGTIGGSNYGDSLDVVAPGDSVICMRYSDGATYWDIGTSFSTAFVTGLASLLISQNPNITPDVVTQIIESTAEDQVGDSLEDTKGYDKYYGYGRINAYKALLKGEELITGKKPKALTNIENAKLISYSKTGNTLILNAAGSKSTSPIIVRIIDASGRLIQQTSLTKQAMTSTIKLSPLPGGMYFYSVKFDGVVHSGKIVM